jgi:hypothetical protein
VHIVPCRCHVVGHHIRLQDSCKRHGNARPGVDLLKRVLRTSDGVEYRTTRRLRCMSQFESRADAADSIRVGGFEAVRIDIR